MTVNKYIKLSNDDAFEKVVDIMLYIAKKRRHVFEAHYNAILTKWELPNDCMEELLYISDIAIATFAAMCIFDVLEEKTIDTNNNANMSFAYN